MGQLPKFNTENDDHSETHPCFEPIVWTNGTNKDNQPDLADLQEKCKQGQTIQHKVKLLDQIFQGNTNIIGMYNLYRGSSPYAHFWTWKKPCYMKLVLVGLYCGPLLSLIPPLTRT